MDNSLSIHHNPDPYPEAVRTFPDTHQDTFSKTTQGFWMYLMTDCLLFATLFTTYAVLHKETFGGPTSKDLFNLSTAFLETMILLFSSVSCGFSLLSALKNKKNQVLGWLAVTYLLGLSFVTIELVEFTQLVQEGNSWTRSAFLSSFFTLVGTHGLHVSVGLIWLLTMMAQVFWFGITKDSFRRLAIFSMFWHFLDLVWIFIFTFVYLIGVL